MTIRPVYSRLCSQCWKQEEVHSVILLRALLLHLVCQYLSINVIKGWHCTIRLWCLCNLRELKPCVYWNPWGDHCVTLSRVCFQSFFAADCRCSSAARSALQMRSASSCILYEWMRHAALCNTCITQTVTRTCNLKRNSDRQHVPGLFVLLVTGVLQEIRLWFWDRACAVQLSGKT